MARGKKGRPVNGWLVVDKPAGVGSTTVVNIGSATPGAGGTTVINTPTVTFAKSVTQVGMPQANLTAQLLGLGGRRDDLQAVAQPLNCGPGDEHRPLEGVLTAAVGVLPGHGGQKAVLRLDRGGAGVHENERAGAIGAFGLARFETGLAE